MYTESNVKLSCNALWQKCVLATLYRAAATHPEIKLLQFKLIRKRKLTAVCSHQTRIGNLDAHLI